MELETIKWGISQGVLGVWCIAATWAFWNEKKQANKARELLTEHFATDSKVNREQAERMRRAFEAVFVNSKRRVRKATLSTPAVESDDE